MNLQYVRRLSSVLLAASALMLSACGKSTPVASNATPPAVSTPAPSASPSSSSTTSSTTPPSLQGIWVTSCRTDGATPYIVELRFNQSTVSESIHHYQDSKCSPSSEMGSPQVVMTLFGTGSAVQGQSGVYELNLASALQGIAPFNVYQVNGNTLNLGQLSTPNAGLDAADRPTTVDTSITFTKSNTPTV